MLLIAVLNFALITYSQTENKKINSVGISVPIIWNNSKAAYYQLGTRKEPEGKGTSFGIGINYSRTIYKNLFGVIGIGYFKQAFGIKRPFDFVAPDGTKPLVQTESYSYDNLHLRLGIGYEVKLSNTISANGIISYNKYNCYKQKYNQTYFPNYSQINNNHIALGNMIDLDFGVVKYISKKISIGVNLLLPISTNWNNDETFYKYDYSNDTQQIGLNKFSFGTIISFNYHF